MNSNRIIKQIFAQIFTEYEPVMSDDGELITTGEGGSGIVYQAIRKADGHSMAVKITGLKTLIVPGAELDRMVLMIRMQQEAAAVNPSVLAVHDFSVIGADIDVNDNVVRTVVLDTDTDTDIGALQLRGSEQILIFSFMENMQSILVKDNNRTGACRCTNELLRCVGRDGRDDLAGSPDGVLYLAYDTACALQDLKARNVAHRDVKPDNIFYDPGSYRFLLGDFGLARIAEEASASTHVGTNGFLAPEIRIGLRKYEPYRGDIYSLGMTMYALLNGLALPGQEPGMLRTNPIEYIQYGHDAVNRTPSPRNGFPQINSLIRMMIATDPMSRPGIDEVLMELDNIALDFGIDNLDDIESRAVDARKIIRLSDDDVSGESEADNSEISSDESYDTEPEGEDHIYDIPMKPVTTATYVWLPRRFRDSHMKERKRYPTAAQIILVLLGITGLMTLPGSFTAGAEPHLLPMISILLSFIYMIYQKKKHFYRSKFMNVIYPVVTLVLSVACMVMPEMKYQMAMAIAAVLVSFVSADIGMMLTLTAIVSEAAFVWHIPTAQVPGRFAWLIFTGVIFIMLMLLFLDERLIRGADIREINGVTCIDQSSILNLFGLFLGLAILSGAAALVFLIISMVYHVTGSTLFDFIRTMRPQAAFGINALVSFIMMCMISNDNADVRWEEHL